MMKKINQQAAKIFCKLLDKMGTQTYLKFTSEGFMPLVMEQVGELLANPYGTGQLYSLAHYYEQNGDLMRDPEMVFIVVDNKKDAKDYDLIGVYPQLFQQEQQGNHIQTYLAGGTRQFCQPMAKEYTAAGIFKQVKI